jgi:hypothetical protein
MTEPKKVDKELSLEYYTYLQKGLETTKDIDLKSIETDFNQLWNTIDYDDKRRWTYESRVWQEEGDEEVLYV